MSLCPEAGIATAEEGRELWDQVRWCRVQVDPNVDPGLSALGFIARSLNMKNRVQMLLSISTCANTTRVTPSWTFAR